MADTLVCYILGAIAVTLAAGAAPIVLHAMFGATLPPSVQSLSDMFAAVFKAGAAVFLGPAQLFKRIRITLSDQPKLPPPDSKRRVG